VGQALALNKNTCSNGAPYRSLPHIFLSNKNHNY
jgi:hypothetical protein